jgi:hypothetical protein
MRRLVWFGLGVAVAVVVVTKGRQWLIKVTPQGIVERLDQASGQLLERAQGALHEFTVARREAEVELRQQAGLE